MPKRLHAIVRGDVQLVGFRWFVAGLARRMGLSGWVRNGEDGRTVEVVAEGEEKALRRLETALQDGPRAARVESVDAEWSEALEGHDSFRIVR